MKLMAGDEKEGGEKASDEDIECKETIAAPKQEEKASDVITSMGRDLL